MLVVWCVISLFILMAISTLFVAKPTENTTQAQGPSEHSKMIQGQIKSKPLEPAKPTPWYMLPLREKK